MQEPKKSKKSEIKAQTGQFFKFTTTRPVAILMVVIGVVVFGWISYKQLPLNLMPDISYPSLTVRTEYAGTAPEEIETTISRPVEQALGVVNNLVSISSISKSGQSDVKLEFTWDTDMNQATADVREKLDQVFLPLEAKRPLILRFDPSLDPIMRLGLYGETSLIYLRYLSEEEIKRILETIEGVAAVKVRGGLEEEIRVELNEQQLALIGIDIQQVRDRLSQENVNLAGGNLKEGQTEYLVRTLNEFKSVKEVSDVVIGTWNGKEIKVRDVADTKRTYKDREIITRLNGAESVEIEVFKEADANIVAVAQRVKDRIFGTAQQQAFVQRMEQAKKEARDKPKKIEATNGKNGKKEDKPQKGRGNEEARNRQAMHARQMTNFVSHQLPEGIKIDLLSDQSVFIQGSVDEVKQTAIIGGLLAVLVLFIFLRNLTATLIVGISIPISIVATFAPMKIFDVSLNIMSLGGMALGIGMLVDNSIVVLESIARCRDEGDSLLEATIRGVSEVGGAVFASTLTTIAVFFPIVFVEGVAGQIFGNLALTVVFSLFASLAVALFLIPMLSSRESSKFIQGIQKDNFFEGHVFQFESERKYESHLHQPGQGLLTTIGLGLVMFFQTAGSIFWKLLKTATALLLALIKQIAVLLMLVVSPLIGLLRVLRIIKFRIGDRLREFAAHPDFWRLTFVKEIWPTFLVNRSAPALLDDFKLVRSRFHNKSVFRKIARALLFPLSLLFVLTTFLFQYILELFFRFAHFFLVAGGVMLKGIFILGRLLFSAPTALFIRGFNWAYAQIEAAYPRILHRALNNRGVVLGSVSLLFLFSVILVAPRLGSELIPEVHQGEFNIDVTLPVGTPVEKTDSRILHVQQFLEQEPGISMIASVSGTDKTANASSEEGEHTSKITVTMKRAGSMIIAEEKLIESVRERMQDYSGIQWKISRPVLFSFKTPIEVEIHGYSLQKLQEVSRKLEERMQAIPGVLDVKSNIQRGNPEVQIVYNRQVLSKFGLNIRDVASIIRNKVRGDVATEFKEQDRKIDVLVRLREKDRQGISDLRRLIVNPGAEKPIPLAAIAEIKVQEGPSEIRRVDQQRTAVISANFSGRSLSDVNEDIFAELQTMEMPDDFTYALSGQNKEMETSLNSLKLALGLAIFLVYIVMASQFESMIHPFVIIFTIPLALIGVILFLFVFNISLSIVVFLGMIMLAGIVVNNAIVLVDYINKLRERGMEKMEAIVEAGKVRLRPIMMTTATTVLGLLPMALGLGDGAEIRTPMAITVIIGLITSTILTLVIIPTVYSLVDRRET
ncbi:MAG: efflux RND transporter permease subunit [bacterium]